MEKTCKAPSKGRGEDWIYAAANQGTLRTDTHHQKLGRVQERLQKEYGPVDTLILYYEASRIVRKYICVILNNSIFATVTAALRN